MSLVAFGAGAALPVAAAFAHGWHIAGRDYVFAVYTYRMQVDPFTSEPLSVRLAQFLQSAPAVAFELGPLLLLVPFGVLALWRRGMAGRVIVAWMGALALALVMGGQFHTHYYVALVPALAIVAAAALSQAQLAARERGALLVSAGLIALVWSLAAAFVNADLMRDEDKRVVSWEVFSEQRYLTNQTVGEYLKANTTPDQTVYALYAAADVYYHARRRSPYPYLWFRGISRIPGAIPQLRSVLRDHERHPAYVAMVQDPSELDPQGRLRAVFVRYYDRVATVNGVGIYRADEEAFERDAALLRASDRAWEAAGSTSP